MARILADAEVSIGSIFVRPDILSLTYDQVRQQLTEKRDALLKKQQDLSKLKQGDIKETKIISDEDISIFKDYLQKSNGKLPKEFFTSKTKFKEFFNKQTGKREGAPQSSKWLLQDNGLYNLVDQESGEVYFSNVDLATGIMKEGLVSKLSSTEEKALNILN